MGQKDDDLPWIRTGHVKEDRVSMFSATVPKTEQEGSFSRYRITLDMPGQRHREIELNEAELYFILHLGSQALHVTALLRERAIERSEQTQRRRVAKLEEELAALKAKQTKGRKAQARKTSRKKSG
jgi:HSP20 family molecular chaperone IbpA